MATANKLIYRARKPRVFPTCFWVNSDNVKLVQSITVSSNMAAANRKWLFFAQMCVRGSIFRSNQTRTMWTSKKAQWTILAEIAHILDVY